MIIDWSRLTDAADPDQQFIALTTAPGTSAHDGLRLLASGPLNRQRPGGR